MQHKKNTHSFTVTIFFQVIHKISHVLLLPYHFLAFLLLFYFQFGGILLRTVYLSQIH